MTHYILQVIFFQLSFLLMYEFLLKKETFFSYNRWYLLLTPVLSLILPLLNFEVFQTVVAAETLVMLPKVFIGGNSATTEAVVATSGETSSKINWWLLIYAAGVLVSGFLFLKKLLQLRQLSKLRVVSAEKSIKIVEVPSSKAAFSFYNSIFLGEKLSEAEKQHILGHELVHVKQKHSLDLLFFEIQKIIFWFNPLVYIFQNRISTVHEFLADAQVVKTTGKQTYYQRLLNTAFNTQNISFINQFFKHSLIKKRIVMLQKSKSKSVAKFKYLLLVPLMLCMLTYVACTTESEPKVEETSQISQEDEQLKQRLREELQQMKADGATFMQIADAFHIEQGKPIKSREGFYRGFVFYEHIIEEGIKRDKANGNFDEEKYANLQKGLNQSYEQYLERSKTNDVQTSSQGEPAGVPFLEIETVPTYPGCEDLASNEEMKNCMTEKINEYVNSNFNAQAVMPYAQEGVNRVFATFTIDETGKITNVKTRGSSTELEEEATRVILDLPQMEPGKNNGENIAVQYALPIIFQK